MSQRYRQQENGEISLTMMSGHERQQENGLMIRNWDTKKQSSGQDDPKGASMFKWHAIFLVSCVIAVLYVDPLFLYLPVINQDDKCLFLDGRLIITAICFRSVFDLIYVAYIILGFRCAYRDEEVSRISGRTMFVTVAWKIIKGYLWSYNFLVDILAILPIPQVLVPFIFTKLRSSKYLDIRKVLSLFVLLQYVPRVLRIYLSWKKHIKSSSKLYQGVRIKIAFNIFFYILASHVLGGLWYFFSVQRETTCWHNACANGIICIPGSFKCDRNSSGNYTLLDDACPINPQNATRFDFGIFQNALDSGIVSSTNIPQKIIYCFWWGLRNLSSLGQNLETSNYFWENCFAIFISIYGLLLLLYFIGNAQTFMQMATTEAATNYAKRLEDIKPKVESWMARNNLPPNMKEPIISCIRHTLKKNKDFDMNKLISHLSKDLVTKIKHHLCLPLLQKAVQNLENQGDQNLLAQRICDSLKPKYYEDNFEIIREGEPVTAMVCTTQGDVLCFKKSNDGNGDSADHQSNIDKFELYGEELLQWKFNHSPPDKKPFPTSTKTVKTLSKVELFTLTADNLNNLVPKHTRAAEFVKGVLYLPDILRSHSKENKGTSRLLEDGTSKS